jgi:hypothetical protein
MTINDDTPMRLYAFGGPLRWRPTQAHKNALTAEAYEGDYFIIPFRNGFALHCSRNCEAGLTRVACGQTLEEIKVIADILAARNNASRKQSHPKDWKEARKRGAL